MSHSQLGAEWNVMTEKRQAQKKASRVKNNITTMQLTKRMKSRIKRIQTFNGFDKQDEALDDALSFFEDSHPAILLLELDDE